MVNWSELRFLSTYVINIALFLWLVRHYKRMYNVKNYKTILLLSFVFAFLIFHQAWWFTARFFFFFLSPGTNLTLRTIGLKMIMPPLTFISNFALTFLGVFFIVLGLKS